MDGDAREEKPKRRENSELYRNEQSGFGGWERATLQFCLEFTVT